MSHQDPDTSHLKGNEKSFRERMRDGRLPAFPEEMLRQMGDGNRMLSMAQEFALPILLWFFDQDRDRGTGRSYLAAVVAIELAMRGQSVVLEDVSRAFIPHEDSRQQRYFKDLVWRVVQTHYHGHQFRLDPSRNIGEVLKYLGRRPR